MTAIFEYNDFRKYLKDRFADEKKKDPAFSHRNLAEKLGLSTSNFILLVMQGKRNLNGDLCLRISEVFKHSRKEATFFEELVRYNQAKTDKERETRYVRMMGLRNRLPVCRIPDWQYEYYSTWYHAVVRELVCDARLKGDPTALARTVVPHITAAQARDSVDLLLKLGFIKRQGKRLIQSSALIGTAPEVNSLAVRNFHCRMGELAVQAFDRIIPRDRNHSCTTVKIKLSTYTDICRRIDDFRRELLALACSDEEGERVYQVNFQVFPVSEILSRKDGE